MLFFQFWNWLPVDVQAVREEGTLFEGIEAIPEGFGGDEKCWDVDEVLHPLGNKVVQLQEGDQQAGPE